MELFNISAVACLCAVLLAGPQAQGSFVVSRMTAQQRFPWTNLVDVVVTGTGTSQEVAQAAFVFYEYTFYVNGSPANAVELFSRRRGIKRWPMLYQWECRFACEFGPPSIPNGVDIPNAILGCQAGRAVSGTQLWPDGPYWACWNVGAAVEKDAGYYFSWGDTNGYECVGGTREPCSRSGVTWKAFDGRPVGGSPFEPSASATFRRSLSQLQAAGYVNAAGGLKAAHDPATAYYGAPWRSPTAAEYAELLDKCAVTFGASDGVSGWFVRSRWLGSGYWDIFLPAVGHASGSDLWNSDGTYPYYGYYWTAESVTNSPDHAMGCSLVCTDPKVANVGRDFAGRYLGRSIRAVRDASSTVTFTPNVTTNFYLRSKDPESPWELKLNKRHDITFDTAWCEGATGLRLKLDDSTVMESMTPTNGVYRFRPPMSGTYDLYLEFTDGGSVLETYTTRIHVPWPY